MSADPTNDPSTNDPSTNDHRTTERIIATGALLIALVGIGIWTGLAPTTLPAGAMTTHLPWFALAALFVVCESLEVYVEIRGEARIIHAGPVVLAMGLALSSPRELLLGWVVGTLSVEFLNWVRYRRFSLLKAGFNLASNFAAMSITVLLYRAVLGEAAVVSPRGWLASAAALYCMNTLTLVTVAFAISVSIGEIRWSWSDFTVSQMIVAAHLAIGQLALNVLWVDWRGLWMIGGMLVMTWLGYRAFVKIRQRYGNLGLLYRFTDTLAGATETDEVIRESLKLARELLRADEALLVLAVPDGAIVRRMGRDGKVRAEAHRGHHLSAPEVALVAFEEPIVVARNERDSALRAVAESFGWSDLASAPLSSDHGATGVLVVGNRIADVSTFDRDDLRLLETFARNTTIAMKVGDLVAELKREAVEKEFQANHDSLTGLPNRTMLGDRLDALLLSVSPSAGVAVLFMDLDGFKDVNDALGHHTGDVLLVEVARRLQRTIGKRGTLARLGGDEFAVVVPDIAELDDAIMLAHEICAAAERPFFLDQLSLEVSMSVGVAVAPTHANDSRTLFQRADVAMYHAKAKRSGVEVYDEAHDHSSTRRLSLVGELRHAVESDQLQLYYQPQTDLLTGDVVAVEALARWPHPVLGFVAPDEFIPIAEQSGMIHLLTRWALRTALTDLARWRARWPQLRMSVNMSTRNLVDPSFVSDVMQLLAQTGVDPDALTLELTESSVMGDPNRSVVMLGQLNELGVRLAIDDFGTGYSSLSYLKRLPVHEVKIDKSFVMNMAADADDTVIVRSTIDLGHNLGLQAVAEGVEDIETWNLLVGLGCDLAQGYFMAKPMAPAALTAWLEERTLPANIVRYLPTPAESSSDEPVPVLRYIAQAS
ncbi:MAG: putative bifunctional diguanylate cyclase/phosphodiesterase [Acidimicrobiia bacterium]